MSEQLTSMFLPSWAGGHKMTPIKLHPCSFFFILDQRLAVNCCFPQTEDNSHLHPHHQASVPRSWWREGNHYQRTKVNISDLPAPNRALWRASLLQKRTFHRFSVDSYLLTKFWKNPPQLSQSLK